MPPNIGSLASRLGLVPATKSVELPFELWVIVLMLVVDAYQKCYECCSSSDLPRFLIEWRKLLDYDYKTSGLTNNWKELRLVCRNWSIILHPKFRPYLQTNESSRFFASRDVRSLVAFDFGHWFDLIISPFPSDQDLLYATRNISTLTIDNGISGTNMKAFIDLIFEHPQYFPLVRSFSYKTGHTLEPRFWERLEKAFPDITTLRVAGPVEGNGSLTLQKVRILELGIKSFPHLSLPSLRHLSLYGEPANPQYDQLFQDHSHVLESLLLQSKLTDASFLEDNFWSRFPNLKLLGTSNHTDIHHPPTGHPFDHLCLYDVSRDDWEIILLSMDNFPRLRHLTLGSGVGLYPMQMGYLTTMCKERRVTLTSLPNEQQMWLVPKLTLVQRIERDIQIFAFVLVVIPVVLVYFILGTPIL